MKRYLLFACERFYPSGGWEDFRESFDLWTEAGGWLADNKPNCAYGEWHVVDSTTWEIVAKGDWE